MTRMGNIHYTLHLTDSCNMACKYCYVKQDSNVMSLETALASVDAAKKLKAHCGIVFFGGEPLLYKDLMRETVDYANFIQARGDARFHYKVTTNGLLLDEEFLRWSRENEVFIAISHDGVRKAHDKNRKDKQGKGTFSRLEPILEALLKERPYAPALMTVDPSTVNHYADSVEYLFRKGFKYIICSLNYAGDWNEASLRSLQRQYKRLAKMYEAWTNCEEKFYLSPFEVKISSHIRGGCIGERCELGKKQVSIAPDGTVYPCVQFVGDKHFAMGNIHTGINETKRYSLYRMNEQEKETCAGCAVRSRCNHFCGCLNRQSTGSIQNVSPVQCANERMLLPIADALAERLYKKRNAMFIQKQYNDMYPLLSLIEDS